jgi:xyloglucan 6-xylosyltransferase
MRTPADGGWLLHPRGGGGGSTKLTQRAINNIRFTLLCAFVTFLVLRGTVGVNRRLVHIAASDRAPPGETAAEDIQRTLREIRADSDSDPEPYDDDGGGGTSPSTPATRHYDRGSAWSTANYSLGPRVTRWNARRRRWLHLNPGFPSRDARGSPRVLLVTASPPGPCDVPGGDHFLLRATKNKIDYCRLHGIELAHITARLDDELTGGWAKLPLLRRLMLAHPEVEWLWWADGDALVTDMGFELPLARYEGTHLVLHGNSYLLFQLRSWVAVSTGSFLIRNCQWSLDLLDAWAVMGPRGRARHDAGKLLTATLHGRPAFEADDQSALIHLLIVEKERWMEKVYLENEYYLHGHWSGLVDGYEEAMEKHHPGYGDDRWPFVTQFVGCKSCDAGAGRSSRSGGNSSDEYPLDRCVRGMERAFNFADNQVLRLYGFRHESLASAEVTRVTNRSANPLEAKEEAISFLKRPKDPVVMSHDVRRNRKRKGKRDSVLERILKRLGWRSEI